MSNLDVGNQSEHNKTARLQPDGRTLYHLESVTQVEEDVCHTFNRAEAADVYRDASARKVESSIWLFLEKAERHAALSYDVFNPEEARFWTRRVARVVMQAERASFFRVEDDDACVDWRVDRVHQTAKWRDETAVTFYTLISTYILDVLDRFDNITKAVVEGRGSGDKVFLITTTAHY